MKIGEFKEFSLIDYPDRISAVVSVTGCNFQCPFCNVPELILPRFRKNQPVISERNVLKIIKKNKEKIDGVVITGGEPTIYQDLPRFIKKLKKLQLLIKIDTNGSNPELLKFLIEESMVDYIAMDVKAPKYKYDQVAGIKVDIRKIEKSISILKSSQVDYEFRTTVVPSLITKEDILEIVKWISPAKKYVLQNFYPSNALNFKFRLIDPYPEEFFFEMKYKIEPFFDVCQIRQ